MQIHSKTPGLKFLYNKAAYTLFYRTPLGGCSWNINSKVLLVDSNSMLYEEYLCIWILRTEIIYQMFLLWVIFNYCPIILMFCTKTEIRLIRKLPCYTPKFSTASNIFHTINSRRRFETIYSWKTSVFLGNGSIFI